MVALTSAARELGVDFRPVKDGRPWLGGDGAVHYGGGCGGEDTWGSGT